MTVCLLCFIMESRASMDDSSDLFKEEGYELGEHLLSDCWGEIFRARYVPHAREVMLRALPAAVGENEGARELVLALVQAWARLDHPCILQVLDWGAARPGVFFATEVPAGRPLGSLLCGGVAPEGADAIFTRLLEAVEAARQRGVLHLGLGLTNIWVGEGAAVRVSEFGLWYAARDFPGLIEPDRLFLAPEQERGERESAATDVYSLGLVLLALYCGLDAAVAAKGGSLPEGLGEKRAVLARCLDERPLARYRCAGELADALGFPPARRAHEPYRDCPLCRLSEEIRAERYRTGAAGSGAARAGLPPSAYAWIAIIALVVVTVAVWWLAFR